MSREPNKKCLYCKQYNGGNYTGYYCNHYKYGDGLYSCPCEDENFECPNDERNIEYQCAKCGKKVGGASGWKYRKVYLIDEDRKYSFNSLALCIECYQDIMSNRVCGISFKYKK